MEENTVMVFYYFQIFQCQISKYCQYSMNLKESNKITTVEVHLRLPIVTNNSLFSLSVNHEYTNHYYSS